MDDALDNVKGALRQINFADIGVRISLACGAVAGTGMLIVVPTAQQKDRSALEIYQRPFDRLPPTDQRAAEFRAAHRRWTNFWANSVYPLTRKLPGAKKPFINPYKKRAGGGGEDESF